MNKAIVIPLKENDDESLTCFICMHEKCEYVIEAKGCYGNNSSVWDGKKLWIGIHSGCANESWGIKLSKEEP